MTASTVISWRSKLEFNSCWIWTEKHLNTQFEKICEFTAVRLHLFCKYADTETRKGYDLSQIPWLLVFYFNQTLSCTHSPMLRYLLSNKCNKLFSNLPQTQFFSLKLQYPSIIASQFANCIIYSSGLKETLLNSVKAACCAGFWGALEFA